MPDLPCNICGKTVIYVPLDCMQKVKIVERKGALLCNKCAVNKFDFGPPQSEEEDGGVIRL